MPEGATSGAGQASSPQQRRGRPRQAAGSLHKKLVVVDWALAKLGAATMPDLTNYLKSESLEGFTVEGESRFLVEILNRHSEDLAIDEDALRAYDANISRHTSAINAAREQRLLQPISWKYFQYLSLLFVEMYLDAYFADPTNLRDELNRSIVQLNAKLPVPEQVTPIPRDGDSSSQLNRLALWNATGSGKTLLMHVNLMQYQSYASAAPGRAAEPQKVLLLTPNDGLSQQHLSDFADDGITAELFSKDASSLPLQTVEILDIHKLTRGEAGPETVAVESLEGNNLVLVDEGHRGASGGDEGAWYTIRADLCKGGFSFEYSATFGQAVSGNAELTDQYAKSVIFDYSYQYFYADGYGKDYRILNLDGAFDDKLRNRYLVGGLLVFFEQLQLYRAESDAMVPFNIAKPLWVFVGSSVNAVRTESSKKVSDVIDILLFLRDFCADKRQSVAAIRALLDDGMQSTAGGDIFEGKFSYLRELALSAEDVYDRILSTVFNAPGGGSLAVERIKGASGEMLLRLGAGNQPFGVINVGDTPALKKLCEEVGFDVTDLEFSSSYFQGINHSTSTITLLIGSKKFTEGWNSWRVSTLGLLNVGRSEGSQIIQLFGRGVRLKGYDFSLKRSAATTLPPGCQPPRHIQLLETLNVFGVRATYMTQFREHLDKEVSPDQQLVPVRLPIVKNLGRVVASRRKLKRLRVAREVGGLSTADGSAFRHLGHVSVLRPPSAAQSDKLLLKNRVQLNLYPRIRVEDSAKEEAKSVPSLHPTKLPAKVVGLLDVDRLVREVRRYRRQVGRHNVLVNRTGIADLLRDESWYDLYIPPEDLSLGSTLAIERWQRIAQQLLCKYVDSFHSHQRSIWEQPHLEYCDVEEEDPNFPVGGYEVLVERAKEQLIDDLGKIAAKIERNDLTSWSFEADANGLRSLQSVTFPEHLYEPLLALDGGVPAVSPVPLNEGERKFVIGLQDYWTKHRSQHGGVDLYVLRNLTRGRGVGFFEAGNFYPDFIVWLVRDGHQDIVFVDPKGLFHVAADDPKVQFSSTIKALESRLTSPAEESIALHSFILSATAPATVIESWGLSPDEIEGRNVLFLSDDDCIAKMMERVGNRTPLANAQ